MNRHIRKPHTPILEEASTWFVEFSEGGVDPSAKEAFVQWLRASPEHVRAYLEISSLWEDADLVAKHRNHDTEALIAQALAASNVVSLGVTTADTNTAQEGTKSARRRKGVVWGVAASSALIVTALSAWIFSGWESYSTDVGEQRVIALSDGSTVELNARSHLRVRFTRAERTVYLVDGEALFHVAHNVSRPFIVHSASTLVRAVGTAFDVYRTKAGTTVTVVEGRVAVLSDEAALASSQSSASGSQADAQYARDAHLPAGRADQVDLFVSAGEQVTVAAQATQAVPQAQKADVSAATAWTQRRLVFNASPLSEVVDQYNRYNERPLIIRDPQLESLNISGVFSAADAASLIAFLREQPGVRVQETDAAIEITAE
jgi:transmembrane sensor